jgi:rubrerythrin
MSMNPLEFAFQMENEGEQFYLKQAENFLETDLCVVFRILAATEHIHAGLLKARLTGLPVDLPEDQSMASARSVFGKIPDLHNLDESLPDQMDAYSLATGVEQRSIDLYLGLLQTASDPSTQALLRFLLKQEQEHLALFDELTLLLSRPKEWVESAEFGPREEY